MNPIGLLRRSDHVTTKFIFYIFTFGRGKPFRIIEITEILMFTIRKSRAVIIVKSLKSSQRIERFRYSTGHI